MTVWEFSESVASALCSFFSSFWAWFCGLDILAVLCVYAVLFAVGVVLRLMLMCER